MDGQIRRIYEPKENQNDILERQRDECGDEKLDSSISFHSSCKAEYFMIFNSPQLELGIKIITRPSSDHIRLFYDQ